MPLVLEEMDETLRTLAVDIISISYTTIEGRVISY